LLVPRVPRAADGTARPEMRLQVLLEDAARLHEQAAIDRLVRHLVSLVPGIGVLQPAGNLLWRPVLFQPGSDQLPQPTMRFVPVKSPDQQAALALHRTRDLLVKQRTQLVNMIRGLLAEFGIEMARGLHHALALAKQLVDGHAADVPQLAQRVAASLAHQVGALQVQLAALEKELLSWHRSSELSQRLATIPGVGVISATALAASV